MYEEMEIIFGKEKVTVSIAVIAPVRYSGVPDDSGTHGCSNRRCCSYVRIPVGFSAYAVFATGYCPFGHFDVQSVLKSTS
jgi:hypothetical protein